VTISRGFLYRCGGRGWRPRILVAPPRIEPRFANKEMVVGKFNQPAELRNGLRHSRRVDEITRKEGEAAVLWFNQVLNKDIRAGGA
jgi:hypothetical protein